MVRVPLIFHISSCPGPGDKVVNQRILHMKFKKNRLFKILAMMNTLIVLGLFGGCSGTKPASIGVVDNQLADCPDSPNCISSTATDQEHSVPPLQLVGEPADLWPELVRLVSGMGRISIVTQTDTYLHAESRSRIFRFVDDLELLLNPDTGQVHIRSASRLGYSDLGVNRRRYQTLQRLLSENGIIRN